MSFDLFPPAPPSLEKTKQTKKSKQTKKQNTQNQPPPLLENIIPQLVDSYSPVITFEKQKPKSPSLSPKKTERIFIGDFTNEHLKHDDTLLKIPTFTTSITEKNKDQSHKPDKWYKKLYNKIKNTFTRKNKKVVPIGGRKRKRRTRKQQKSKSKRKTL